MHQTFFLNSIIFAATSYLDFPFLKFFDYSNQLRTKEVERKDSYLTFLHFKNVALIYNNTKLAIFVKEKNVLSKILRYSAVLIPGMNWITITLFVVLNTLFSHCNIN